MQKQFKEASKDFKDEKENREKSFEPITRELVQIKEAFKRRDHSPGSTSFKALIGHSPPFHLTASDDEELIKYKTLNGHSPSLQSTHPALGPNGIGNIASKYIAHTDLKFVIWFDKDIAYIGDKKIIIDDNDIIIGNDKYIGTEGLWALLSHPKGVPEELYNDNDSENYRKIVISTNCMYANNDSSTKKAKSSVNEKWKKIISPLWKDRLEKGGRINSTGSGILKYTENPIEYKYVGNDISSLKERVDYLHAQEKAGNNNFHNEKLGILHFISGETEKNIDKANGIENLRTT